MPVIASKIASLRPLARRALSTTLRRAEEQHVLRSAYAPQVMPPGGLTQYLLQTAKEHSHKTYMVDGVSGETLSYGTLVDKIHRFGGHIQSRMGGIEPRVGIFMANNMEYAPLLLGTISVGAVATTLNHTYTAGEVAYQVMDSEANILVVDSAREKRALKAIGMIEEEVRQGTYKKPVPELLVVGESKTGRSNLRKLLEDPTAPFATEVELDCESTSIIPYSSGTTGRPKGVEVKHGAFSTCTEMFNNPDVMRAFKADQQDIVMGVLPYYHMYGMLVLLMVTLRKGGTVLNLSRFDPDEFNNAIRTYKPTILPCVPPMLKFLVETDGLTRDDLKQVHSLVCGAAPVSKNSVEKFAAKTGGNIDFSEGYGMTEVLVTHSTPKTNPKLGFCGQLMPNCEAKVIDTDTGLALPANQRGELLLKTPCMMNGYYNKPEATAETIDSEGWLHTGDIAFYDEDHFFSIVDRIKELIKVKGYQVSPSELEDVLLKHESIADVGIVGVEDDRCGEVPRAYIIPSKGHDLTETEVNAYMAVHLARHKQLAGGIKFVEELPKNPSGKLLRRVLQQQANAGD